MAACVITVIGGGEHASGVTYDEASSGEAEACSGRKTSSVTGGEAIGGGKAGGGEYVYCTAFVPDELWRRRTPTLRGVGSDDSVSTDGRPTGTGSMPVLSIGHLDRLRGGTLREDPTTAGHGWEAVKPLIGSKVTVDGMRYRRLALYRTPLCGDLPLSPCQSADAAAADDDAATADLADAPQWVLDGVVLLPTPATALSRWEVSGSVEPNQGTAARTLVLADDAASCAAVSVAYYDAMVALGEYDSLSAFVAHAPADCVATVRALLVQVSETGEHADDVMEADEALSVMGDQ